MGKTLDKPKRRNPYNPGRFYEDDKDAPNPRDRLWERQGEELANVKRLGGKAPEKGAVSWPKMIVEAPEATPDDEPSRREIIEHANALADELGMSRQQFYLTALVEFVEKIENERLTQEYNEAYSGGMEDAEKELLRDVKEYHRRRLSV